MPAEITVDVHSTAAIYRPSIGPIQAILLTQKIISIQAIQYRIISHDFLPPAIRRGSHVKSDNTHRHTHTVIEIHPLAYILDT